MIRTALALARRGMHVFPCLPRRKEPATARGCKDATTDPATIRQWWDEQPAYNVAIATGAVSGVIAVDVDGAEAAMRQLEVEHGAMPPTVETITTRGRHIYLRHPGGIIPNSAGKVAPGIDTRGDGGYVLAPPSVHPSGRAYAWSVDSAKAIAAAPDWLIDKIATPANGHSATTSAEWRELVEHGVDEGRRDNTLTRIAGHLLRRHVDPLLTLELMHALNAARCMPPLPTNDIERIVASVAGKELKRRGASNGQ